MAWNPLRRPTPEEDAAAVVQLLRQALAEHGVETTLTDGALEASDGRVFGLAGLTAAASDVPRRRWRGLAREHVARLLAAQEAPPPESYEDVQETVHLRLTHPDYLPLTDVARPWAGGLVVLPVLDLPDTVEFLSDPDLVASLGGLERLHETGMANLRRLTADEVVDLDHGVRVSIGGFLNASRVLAMETLLAQDLGVELPAHGVLFAIPHRHVVALHVVTGADLVPALQLLAGFAKREHDEPGPISDQVFLWRGGAVQQVTRTEPDGRTGVHVEGMLAEVMAELGLLEG